MSAPQKKSFQLFIMTYTPGAVDKLIPALNKAGYATKSLGTKTHSSISYGTLVSLSVTRTVQPSEKHTNCHIIHNEICQLMLENHISWMAIIVEDYIRGINATWSMGPEPLKTGLPRADQHHKIILIDLDQDLEDGNG